MVFTSYTFLFVFLPVFLLVYYGLLGRHLSRYSLLLRTVWLLLAGYIFYGWERYDLCWLVLFSTTVDFFCGRGIARSRSPRTRRALLCTSIALNLGLLGFFKYFNFGLSVVSDASSALGIGAVESPWPSIVLPVGISFYTFQSMSYTIDVYRGRTAAVERGRALDFYSFVAMFSQLVMGPIVRFRNIRHQFRKRQHSFEQFSRGCFFFAIGSAKKVLIADNLTPLSDSVFELTEPSLWDSWVGMLASSFRIYFDFSGYSDMAVGLGLMIGFTLPQNFNSPFKAESMAELWRRWHMTLTSWLRDYVYRPLGGSKRSRLTTMRNIMITMTLCGLWHGAAWTFVLWGVWSGFLLVIERLRGDRTVYAGLPRPVRITSTFMLFTLSTVVFFAPDLTTAAGVYAGMVGANGADRFDLAGPHPILFPMCILTVACLITFWGRTTLELSQRLTWPRSLLALIAFGLASLQTLTGGFNPFTYFQF